MFDRPATIAKEAIELDPAKEKAKAVLWKSSIEKDMNPKFPSPHRVLVRSSDTELKLQVLFEAPDQEMVDHVWKHFKKLIIDLMTDNGISASIF
jgi:phosphomannomutase